MPQLIPGLDQHLGGKGMRIEDNFLEGSLVLAWGWFGHEATREKVQAADVAVLAGLPAVTVGPGLLDIVNPLLPDLLRLGKLVEGYDWSLAPSGLTGTHRTRLRHNARHKDWHWS